MVTQKSLGFATDLRGIEWSSVRTLILKAYTPVTAAARKGCALSTVP
jgi:hypothetical protein